MRPHHLIILLYDSVTNSVFESQVLKPYAALVRSGLYTSMTIISYENRDFFTKHQVQECTESIINAHDIPINVHFLERPSFFGIFSLHPLIKPLHQLLSSYPEHTLIARGPLSAYLAHHAQSTTTQKITLQARGLLYEEYRLAHRHASVLLKPLHYLRAYQYKKLEQYAYQQTNSIPTTIETVSPALQHYLQTNYQPIVPLTIAAHDTPAWLSAEERCVYRKKYRTLFTIDDQVPVYVYNGSLKPWQCPQETFCFFEDQWQQDKQSVLLFITQEKDVAQRLAQQYVFPTTAIRIIHLSHHEVVPALCAADYGLLFRKEHVINWTSRPTKLLEYQSAGLHIIHNNTIQILQNTPNSSYAQLRT